MESRIKNNGEKEYKNRKKNRKKYLKNGIKYSVEITLFIFEKIHTKIKCILFEWPILLLVLQFKTYLFRINFVFVFFFFFATSYAVYYCHEVNLNWYV